CPPNDPGSRSTVWEGPTWGIPVQSFMREGLIADMTVTIVPILIGEGKRMFGPLDADIDLRLLESRSFPSGLVTSRYEVS
ncbi:MAG: dihydrofolate reductase family protein, partial [Proteobacteria bacterium]|nr:dihydrofolate reductase family protein [Pseudomonadota bacterium]